MKVYIVIGKGGYDNEEIYAVFSTEKMAKDYKNKTAPVYRIEEWEVDEEGE